MDINSPKYSGKKVQLGELDTYIDDVLCRCAERSQKLGYEYFGVQNHGEEFYLGVKFITMILVTVNVGLTQVVDYSSHFQRIIFANRWHVLA